MYVRLFDGSYFRSLLYFLTFGFKKKPKTHCTACLYGMLSRIILLIRDATALLPESECKGIAFSWTTKTFTIFFSWNSKPFLTDVDFQGLTKTLLLSIFGENRTHVKNKETRLRFFNIKEWNFLQKQEAEELKPYKKTSPRQKTQ